MISGIPRLMTVIEAIQTLYFDPPFNPPNSWHSHYYVNWECCCACPSRAVSATINYVFYSYSTLQLLSLAPGWRTCILRYLLYNVFRYQHTTITCPAGNYLFMCYWVSLNKAFIPFKSMCCHAALVKYFIAIV